MKKLSKKITWDINQQEVLTTQRLVTGKVALYRNDNKNLLGLVSKKYKPISNAVFMQFAERIAQTGKFELAGFDEMRNGKLILGYLENKEKHLRVANYPIREYLLLANSHDGSRPFFMGTASTFIRCENFFYANLPLFSKKHSANIDLQTLRIEKIISQYNELKSSVYADMASLEKKRIEPESLSYLLRLAFSILHPSVVHNEDPERILTSYYIQKLKSCIEDESRALGNNAFGVFNGITKFTTHHLNKSSQTESVDGKSEMLNKKAYQYLITL